MEDFDPRTRKAGLPWKVLGLLGLAPLLLSACGGSDDGPAANLFVQVASYEEVANVPGRIIVGLLTDEQDFVSYGTVEMSFSYLGAGQTTQTPEPYQDATANFLPIPGTVAGEIPTETAIGPPTSGIGVYAVDPITFNRAGFWQVEVTAEAGGKKYDGVGAFQVFETSQTPAPGEDAIASDNWVIGSDVVASAVDSRATTMTDVPDAELHRLTIAQALEEDKPLLIVFSTPVFCVSRFCGPVTDTVQGLQTKYGDQANFVHIEIWSDFQNRQINPAAADWLYRNGDLHEPWVFLVDKSGKIRNRWDNVVTEGEVVPALEAAINSN